MRKLGQLKTIKASLKNWRLNEEAKTVEGNVYDDGVFDDGAYVIIHYEYLVKYYTYYLCGRQLNVRYRLDLVDKKI